MSQFGLSRRLPEFRARNRMELMHRGELPFRRIGRHLKRGWANPGTFTFPATEFDCFAAEENE
jgi:hypothetical protein